MRIIVSLACAALASPLAYLLLEMGNVSHPLLSTVGIVAAAFLATCRAK